MCRTATTRRKLGGKLKVKHLANAECDAPTGRAPTRAMWADDAPPCRFLTLALRLRCRSLTSTTTTARRPWVYELNTANLRLLYLLCSNSFGTYFVVDVGRNNRPLECHSNGRAGDRPRWCKFIEGTLHVFIQLLNMSCILPSTLPLILSAHKRRWR